MSKFKVGDSVIRVEKHRGGGWARVAAAYGLPADAPHRVEAVKGGIIFIGQEPWDEGLFYLCQQDAAPSNSDAVNSPRHYASGGVECVDAIKASMSSEAFKGYLKGNVQKYLWRYEKKVAPLEDLHKAQVYLRWLIEANQP